MAERATALKARLDGLRARPAEIVTRRAAGEHRDSDGPDLALLDADIEGTEGLLDRLVDEVSTQSPGIAAAKLQDATKAWEAAVQSARTAALRELVAVLDERLTLTAQALRESSTQFSDHWKPSRELQVELTRVGLGR